MVGDVDEQWIAVQTICARGSGDGSPRPDRQVVVGLGDAVEARDVAQVDEQGRLRQTQLDQRDEAVTAGEQLRLPFTVLEDPQDLVEVRGANVVELAGNHRAWTLLPARVGAIR